MGYYRGGLGGIIPPSGVWGKAPKKTKGCAQVETVHCETVRHLLGYLPISMRFFPLRLAAILILLCLLGVAGLGLWAGYAPRPPLLDGLPFSRLILDAKGRPLRLGLADDGIYRLRISLDAVHPDLVRATLLYEDRWFYRHPGVNPAALARAFAATYLQGSRRMGGSTLTMQVARLRFRMRTDSWLGKARQILMAIRLEAHYSKREILEAYFNLAPYGSNVEGAEAAARIYFHVPASQLSLAESLALAITPQNPGGRNPLGNRGGNSDLFQARQRLATAWPTTLPGEASSPAPMTPELLTAPLQVYGPAALPFAAPHLSTELLHAAGLPERVASTLDQRHQQALEGVLTRFSRRMRQYGAPNAAALLLHWPDMSVRALAGSSDFHDAGIQGQVDASRARRSPGSTLKPFIYALALDQGLIHPRTILADAPRSFNDYEPENIDQRFQGPLPAARALTMSRNIPAISLAARLRYPDLYTFLRRAGVDFPREEKHYGLSLVLGGAEVTMRELAALYAMLPNQGLWRPVRVLADDTRPPLRLLSPEAAFITLDMMREPGMLRSGPRGRETRLGVHLKTGTSNGFRDAWCAGIFGPYVLVVWVGNCDNSANPLFVGRGLAMPLFMDIAVTVAGMEPLRDLRAEPPAPVKAVRLPVCAATGDTDITLCPDNTVDTWFIPGVSPIAPTGILRRILRDRETGLRACRESPTTEEIVWEFWPSDMTRIFRLAGIRKAPPPDWMPGCGNEGVTEPVTEHTGLRITTPKSGITYHLSLSRPERNVVLLTAAVPPDATALFWFAENRSLGRVAPGEHLPWTPPPGVTRLRVVDDKGRSAMLRFTAETVE